MLTLTPTEEKIMLVLWKLEKATSQEIFFEMKETKTAFNSIVVLLHQLSKKGIVKHRRNGRSYIYYPILKISEYQNFLIEKLIVNYFSGDQMKLKSKIDTIYLT